MSSDARTDPHTCERVNTVQTMNSTSVPFKHPFSLAVNFQPALPSHRPAFVQDANIWCVSFSVSPFSSTLDTIFPFHFSCCSRCTMVSRSTLVLFLVTSDTVSPTPLHSFYVILLGFSFCYFSLTSRITGLTEKVVTEIRTTHQAVEMPLRSTNT